MNFGRTKQELAIDVSLIFLITFLLKDSTVDARIIHAQKKKLYCARSMVETLETLCLDFNLIKKVHILGCQGTLNFN